MIGENERVALGWCDGGQVDGNFAASLVKLFWSPVRQTFDQVIHVNGGLVSRLRNIIVKKFLDEGQCDWLLCIDSDEKFTPEDVEKLLMLADPQDYPVLTGVVFAEMSNGTTHIVDPKPLLYTRDDQGLYWSIEDYPENAIMEIDGAGMGFMLIHRSVLEAIRDGAPADRKDWAWFGETVRSNVYVGEDFVFCERVQDAGFKIRAHTGVVVDHHKYFWLNAAYRQVPPAAPTA